MRGRAYLILFFVGLVLLAIGAWTVEGVRWALTGERRPRFATA